MVDPWPVLGIGPTGDLRRIKKAYAARLKHVHPEDDAQGFQRLRAAFEAAVAFARWQADHCDGTTDEAPAPAVPPAPEETDAHFTEWPASVETTPEASSLASAVARLDGDPERRASPDAWRELLATDSLWNLDTRHAFETELIRRLVGGELVLAPSVWALLQQEFHWSEGTLSLRHALPPGTAEELLGRLARAPIEYASRLCEEGRYERARSLLQEITRTRSPLSRAAHRLLRHCEAEESADVLMSDVRELHADERGWTSAAEWRRLLDRPALGRSEIRDAFQRKLFAHLAESGHGMTGPVWELLESRFRWSRDRPAADLARAARVLGPAMVAAIDGASPSLRHAEVIARLSPLVAHLEGAAGERARQLFGESCRTALDIAEGLERRERFQRAVQEAALVARADAGPLAARARELVERAGRKILGEAQRQYARKRFRAAIAQLEPAVNDLPPGLVVEGRLLLARCHLADHSYAKAEEPLEDVLRADPMNVPALVLMATVKEESGQRDTAAAIWFQVVQLDSDNEKASRRLERLQKELRNEVAPAEGGTRLVIPQGAWWLVWIITWLAIRHACSPLRDPFEHVEMSRAAPFVIVVAAILALILLAVSERRSGKNVLDLDEDDVPSSPWRRWLPHAWAASLLLLIGLTIAFFWTRRPGGDGRPDRTIENARPAQPESTPPPNLLDEAWAPTGREDVHSAPRGRPKDVRILHLATPQLPLRRGRTVHLSASVWYELSAGGGVVKLIAVDQPGGTRVVVAATEVKQRSGTLLLSGQYRVPNDATRIDVAVPLYAGSANETRTTATAFLAAGP